MQIYGYEIYQLLYMFAFYAVLGWGLEQLFYTTTGYAVKRGFLRGPFGLLYGLGGLFVVLFVMRITDDIRLQLVIMAGAAILVQGFSVLVIRFISGTYLYRFSPLAALIAGACGLIPIYKVQEPLVEYAQMLPPFWMMIALLVFYVPFVWQLIGTSFLLHDYREAMEEPEFLMPADPLDEAVRALRPYRRWLRAYPEFYRRTLQDMEEYVGEERAEELMADVMRKRRYKIVEVKN